jgi:hypothetical protein
MVVTLEKKKKKTLLAESLNGFKIISCTQFYHISPTKDVTKFSFTEDK